MGCETLLPGVRRPSQGAVWFPRASELHTCSRALSAGAGGAVRSEAGLGPALSIEQICNRLPGSIPPPTWAAELLV